MASKVADILTLTDAVVVVGGRCFIVLDLVEV